MSESVKKSVRLNTKTVNIIKALHRAGEVNWSGSINDIANRYSLLIEHLLPDMTDNEKAILATCYNGRYFGVNDIEREASIMHWLIKEAGDEFPDEASLQAFFEKVKNWGVPERIAAIHFATSFWASPFLEE